MTLAWAFWVAHTAVWLSGMGFFQLLSASISMAAKPVVGVPMGLLFVFYNMLALVGVTRSARRGGTKRVFRFAAVFASALLLVLSAWVPLYFLGRPIFVI